MLGPAPTGTRRIDGSRRPRPHSRPEVPASRSFHARQPRLSPQSNSQLPRRSCVRYGSSITIEGGSHASAFVGGTSHSDAKAFAAYAVGFLPIPVPYLDLYGKAGLARWRLNGSSPLVSAPFSTNGTEFAWGGGVQVHIGNIGGRLEY